MSYSAQTPPASNTTLASSFVDQMVLNDQSFHDGTGIAALEIGSVTAVKNDYKFSAYVSTNYVAPATPHIVQFDTKGFDTSTNYSTSTFKFTAPVAGFYSFTACVTNNTNSGIFYDITLYKNASVAVANGSGSVAALTNGGFVQNNSLAALVQASASDTFYVQWIGQTGTGNYTIAGGVSASYFQGYLVSQT